MIFNAIITPSIEKQITFRSNSEPSVTICCPAPHATETARFIPQQSILSTRSTGQDDCDTLVTNIVPFSTLFSSSSLDRKFLLHETRDHRPFFESPNIFKVLKSFVLLLSPEFALRHSRCVVKINNFESNFSKEQRSTFLYVIVDPILVVIS